MISKLLTCQVGAALLVLCCALPPVSGAPDKSGQTTCYKLTQKSFELGVLTILANDSGLRASNDGRGYFIVSRPPKWDVIIVRPKAKIMAVMPLEQWCSKGTLLFLLSAGAWDGDWTKRPSTGCVLCGIPAHRYLCPYPTPLRTHKDLLLNEEEVHVERRKVRTTLTVLDLKLPEPGRRILERLLGTPHAVGAPGKFENLYLDGRVDQILTTKSCSTAPVSAEAFTCPQAFKQVSARELTMSLSEKNEFDALGADMDLGRSFGKSKGPK